MKRPSKSLPSSLEHRLSGYVLAASAAGVSLLALAQTSEGKIVYTPADKSIPPNHSFYVDLNHDGVDDFRFLLRSTRWSTGFSHTLTVDRQSANAVQGDLCGSYRCAAALSNGVKVGPKNPFVTRSALMFFSRNGDAGSSSFGPWLHMTKQAYLGLKLTINGKIHFGWARFRRIERAPTTVLTGYAYETIPNKPIVAGKTHGKDVVTVTEPASLGALAAGANGLHTWRQK